MEFLVTMAIGFVVLWGLKQWEAEKKLKRQAHFRERDVVAARRSPEDLYYARRAQFLRQMRHYSSVPDVPSYKNAYLFLTLDYFVEAAIRNSKDTFIRTKLHSLMSDYMEILPEYLMEVSSLDLRAPDDASSDHDHTGLRKTLIEDQISSLVDGQFYEILMVVRSNDGGLYFNFTENGGVSDLGKSSFPALNSVRIPSS